MSEAATLKAERREGTGKGAARKLRAAGRVPAVVYGADSDAQSLTVDAHEARLLFERISVENTIVSLEIEGESGAVDTLVREVQVHPYRQHLVHVDFLRIQKGVAVHVQVPVHFEGTPKGVRLSGGMLEQHVHDLDVRCIPSAIPDHLEVDVNALDIGDSLHVSDIAVPAGVEIVTEAGRTLCTVVLPKGAESEAAAAEGEAAGAEA
ncbi:MAG: 50S ribosomal protein L25/general stress protein Ctc [Gemmatimonadota bacterium]|nr:50S ribosomal protein L25/general stress protein Ctc [Gemmatimonadota bacterium]